MIPEPTPSSPEILIVDDDTAVRRSLYLFLRGHGYRVKAYPDLRSIVNDPEAQGASLLLADYQLVGEDGFEVLRRLRAAGFVGSAVLVTAFGTNDLTRKAEAEGFDLVLDKPVRRHQLLSVSKSATGHP